MTVRSAGISDKAKRTLSARDIAWAELILVMEESHKKRILQLFREAATVKTIITLDIPDEFHYMAPELVDLIRESVEPILADHLIQ